MVNDVVVDAPRQGRASKVILGQTEHTVDYSRSRDSTVVGVMLDVQPDTSADDTSNDGQDDGASVLNEVPVQVQGSEQQEGDLDEVVPRGESKVGSGSIENGLQTVAELPVARPVLVGCDLGRNRDGRRKGLGIDGVLLVEVVGEGATVGCVEEGSAVGTVSLEDGEGATRVDLGEAFGVVDDIVDADDGKWGG